jgi:glycerophosphoryl diester phosphodiesterase
VAGSPAVPWPAENTIAAFERARREGTDAIELDARTCRGGDVVVFHDEDLGRMTAGVDGRAIAHVSRAELARVRLASSGDAAPSLDDALAWAREAGLAVNLELKRDVPNRAALAYGAARAMGRHRGVEVLVSSFDPALLAMIAALVPGAPRAWLTHHGQRPWEPIWRRLATRGPIHAVHLERTMASPALVAHLRAAGKRVGVWTVNDAREARDLVAIGVDWIITDAPGAVRAALTRT